VQPRFQAKLAAAGYKASAAASLEAAPRQRAAGAESGQVLKHSPQSAHLFVGARGVGPVGCACLAVTCAQHAVRSCYLAPCHTTASHGGTPFSLPCCRYCCHPAPSKPQPSPAAQSPAARVRCCPPLRCAPSGHPALSTSRTADTLSCSDPLHIAHATHPGARGHYLWAGGCSTAGSRGSCAALSHHCGCGGRGWHRA
jgi:hypothetical protein